MVSVLVGAEKEAGDVDKKRIDSGYRRGSCKYAGASFDQGVSFLTLLIADQIVAATVVRVRETETVVISCRINFQNVSQLITRGGRHDDGGVISRSRGCLVGEAEEEMGEGERMKAQTRFTSSTETGESSEWQ